MENTINKQVLRRSGVYDIYDSNGNCVDTLVNTGEIIKARRKELHMTQQQLADAIGTHKATISRYESGYIDKVPVETLNPIAHALQCSPLFLIGVDPVPGEEEIAAYFAEREEILDAYEAASPSVKKAIKVLLGLE